MARPGQDVHQYAIDGGDTSPATAAEIKARNEAVQTYTDEVRKVYGDLDTMRVDAQTKAKETEEAVAAADKPLMAPRAKHKA